MVQISGGPASCSLAMLSAQVTRIEQGTERGVLSFDVIAETLRATNLGLLECGSHANFERCVSSNLGIHICCCGAFRQLSLRLAVQYQRQHAC